MKGFNDQAASQPGTAPTAPGGQGGPMSPPEQRQATPEQQEKYNRLYGLSMLALYDEKFMQTAAKMLSTAQSKPDAMARIAAGIGIKIFTKSVEQGDPIEPIIMVEAGREFMGEIAEFAQRIGIQVSPEDMETAYYMASDMVRNHMEKSGLIDVEALANEAEQARSMFDEQELSGEMQRVNAMKKGAFAAKPNGGQA